LYIQKIIKHEAIIETANKNPFWIAVPDANILKAAP
jgi:hypothetical protein